MLEHGAFFWFLLTFYLVPAKPVYGILIFYKNYKKETSSSDIGFLFNDSM